jgi:hypothetical protein
VFLYSNIHGSFIFEHLQALQTQAIQPFAEEEVGIVAGCDVPGLVYVIIELRDINKGTNGESRATIPHNPNRYPPL